MSDNQVPRRAVLEQLTPEELAIYNAIQAIEKLGADPKLTTVVNTLVQAGNQLSDFVDNVQPGDRPLTLGEELVGLTFNPSNLTIVDQAKRLSADLIDMVAYDHNLKTNNGADSATWSRNVLRTAAITAVIQAQMAVVKILTWNK